MKIKRDFAAFLIFLALAGCGRGEAQEAVISENVITIEETPLDMESAQNVITDRITEDISTVDVACIKTIKVPFVENLDKPYACTNNAIALVSTREELEYLESDDCDLITVNQEYSDFVQEYSLTEYNYIMRRVSTYDNCYGGAHIIYISKNNELSFESIITSQKDIVIMYDPNNKPDCYLDIAAIPKEFIEERQINNLYSPQEAQKQMEESARIEGTIVVNGESATDGSNSVSTETQDDKKETDDLVSGAYVTTINCGFVNTHSFWDMVLIRSEEEMQELAERDENLNSLYSYGGKLANWIKDYLFSEYNYIIKKTDAGSMTYPFDAIAYRESTGELYFTHREMRINISCSEGRYRYVDIAIIPKTFFENKEIKNLISPQEWEEHEISIIVM